MEPNVEADPGLRIAYHQTVGAAFELTRLSLEEVVVGPLRNMRAKAVGALAAGRSGSELARPRPVRSIAYEPGVMAVRSALSGYKRVVAESNQVEAEASVDEATVVAERPVVGPAPGSGLFQGRRDRRGGHERRSDTGLNARSPARRIVDRRRVDPIGA